MTEDNNVKETVENAEELGEFTSALKQFHKQFEQLESRVEQLEDKLKTKVRVVDTGRGKRIVLENQQQTWFSPNYFRKILDRLDSDGENSEMPTVEEET